MVNARTIRTQQTAHKRRRLGRWIKRRRRHTSYPPPATAAAGDSTADPSFTLRRIGAVRFGDLILLRLHRWLGVGGSLRFTPAFSVVFKTRYLSFFELGKIWAFLLGVMHVVWRSLPIQVLWFEFFFFLYSCESGRLGLWGLVVCACWFRCCVVVLLLFFCWKNSNFGVWSGGLARFWAWRRWNTKTWGRSVSCIALRRWWRRDEIVKKFVFCGSRLVFSVNHYSARWERAWHWLLFFVVMFSVYELANDDNL